jgi:queuine tRNA-ribosyltransferase
MFDCVMPTRNARHGLIYTSEGIINIKNQRWQRDFSAIDAHSPAPTSRLTQKPIFDTCLLTRRYSECSSLTLQNLSFYLWLVKASKRILDGTSPAGKRRWSEK